MPSIRIRRFVATAVAAAALMGGASPAVAQTREHILLARQVRVPAQEATPSTDGQPCSDWTNPDGTHGTNCPAPAPSPGGGKGSSAVVSLGKLGRFE
ncbi:MAG: hypothetical protein M3144_03700 [Actinomycetota bacterium]|nr:hypothetical protein [Actinomycetota bacterium]